MSDEQHSVIPAFPWTGTSIASFLFVLIGNALIWVVAFVNAGWEGPNTEFGLFAGKCASVLLAPMWLLASFLELFPAFVVTVVLESVGLTYVFYFVHRYLHRSKNSSATAR